MGNAYDSRNANSNDNGNREEQNQTKLTCVDMAQKTRKQIEVNNFEILTKCKKSRVYCGSIIIVLF